MKIKVKAGAIELKTADPYLRSFLIPGDVRVNVWRSEKSSLFTVGTCLNHPKKGKTQLFRKNCTEQQVMAILKNPRIHTGKGYYRK